MLNFLRRIRRKLIDEGSLKRYLIYAIGEILLVMIGILLALQVNNWNEKNKSQKEEQVILKSLQTEFQDNIKNLEQVLESHNRTTSNIEKVLTRINDGNESVLNPEVRIELRNAVLGKTYDPQFGVLNSLLNSEKINLIESDLLRIQIAKIPGLLDDYSEDEELVVKSIFDFYLPELFRFNPENIKSEGHIIVNYLNFLIPNIQTIVEEGESLKLTLAKDIEMIESQIN